MYRLRCGRRLVSNCESTKFLVPNHTNCWSVSLSTTKIHCTESFFLSCYTKKCVKMRNWKFGKKVVMTYGHQWTIFHTLCFGVYYSLFWPIIPITVVIKKNWSLYLYCFFWECCFPGELISLIFNKCSCCIPWLRYVIHTYYWIAVAAFLGYDTWLTRTSGF